MVLFCFKGIKLIKQITILPKIECKTEIHLRQPWFTCSAYGQFTKKKEIEKSKETRGSRHIYQDELDKTCFQHAMAHKDFEDLPRRKASDKCYVIKHLILQKVYNMMDINVDLVQWFINVLIKSLLMVLLHVPSQRP